MKVCVIRQPAGLGDILFTQKIAKKILETKKADIVYWPVSEVYSYLNEYLGTENIIFINENLDFPGKDLYQKDIRNIVNNEDILYVPLQRADSIVPYKNSNYPMYCKYELVGLNYNNWKEYTKIKRNFKREKYLTEIISPKHTFNLVNKTFGTYPGQQIISSIPNIKNEIEIKNLGFDRPFDWMELFERAQSIHTAETSFCYILALLNLNSVHVYARNTKTDFSYVKDIFPSKWEYIS